MNLACEVTCCKLPGDDALMCSFKASDILYPDTEPCSCACHDRGSKMEVQKMQKWGLSSSAFRWPGVIDDIELERRWNLVRPIINRLIDGQWLLASMRPHGAAWDTPLVFNLVPRPFRDVPLPDMIPVDSEAGMLFISSSDAYRLSRFAIFTRLGYVDVGLPDGFDYWCMVQ